MVKYNEKGTRTGILPRGCENGKIIAHYCWWNVITVRKHAHAHRPYIVFQRLTAGVNSEDGFHRCGWRRSYSNACFVHSWRRSGTEDS